jgi:hypothetical protein
MLKTVLLDLPSIGSQVNRKAPARLVILIMFLGTHKVLMNTVMIQCMNFLI